MKSIDQASLSGKKVLVRVDYNVPQNEQLQVTSTTRIKRTVETVNKITNEGGIAILMSHLGRPKGEVNDTFSLKHIVSAVSETLGKPVVFLGDVLDSDIEEKINRLHSGEVALLENLRFHKEEEKGDPEFAKAIAKLGDIYVNDAFGTAHREHASTATIAKFFPGNAYAGYLLYSEVQSLKKVLEEKKSPFTAIIGGAKVSTKINILKNLMEKVDNLIVGGGMSYTFLSALGFTHGDSLFEEDMVPVAQEILEQANIKGINIYLPVDNLCADKFAEDSNTLLTEDPNVPNNWLGMDIGVKTIELFKKVILDSKTILWNGPVGVFEMDKFAVGTKAVAEAIAESTKNGAYSLIGGGDSIAALGKFGLSKEVSYISTGGGAMLEYLEGIELPGIKALEEN
ncbi:MAG: phosphoglycerate kinase [Bacteroidetes bacterium]|nr:phosphoglycerate kinase [Bacteroidota bacterium]MCL1968293.1 phosphoglycerate kinase [Bacteroidota bacterium]